MAVIDCADKSTRDINLATRALLGEGEPEIRIINPAGRHNLGVGLVHSGKLIIEGTVGNFCGGLSNVADIEIHGNAGWGVADNLMSGQVVVRGTCSSAAGPTLRGGTLVIHGNAGPRCGISMKGGTILVGGNVGTLTGFMMQKGTIVVCGNAAAGLGDSMYQGTIFLAGECKELGADCVEADATGEELDQVRGLLAEYGLPQTPNLRKYTSGRKLWNFTKKEHAVWKAAL